MSALNIASIQSLSANTPPVIKESGGSEVGQFCRAWVVFNGASSPITITDSFNVSSITDNGVGDYTINYTSAFPAVACVTAFQSQRESHLWANSVSSATIRTRDSSGILSDGGYVSLTALAN